MEVELKHSGLGIAAFVVSVVFVASFLVCVGVVVMGGLTYEEGSAVPDNIVAGIYWGYALLAGLLLLSASLGVAGLCGYDETRAVWLSEKQTQRKFFAVLAMVMDAFVVAIFFGLFVIFD